MKKTIEIQYEIGEEVVIKVLKQRGIVSMIGIGNNNNIRYRVEYSASGNASCYWLSVFEMEKLKDNTIGFVKEIK